MSEYPEPTLATLLETFFRHRLAAQRRASPATLATYRDALKLLLIFSSQRSGRAPSKLSLDDLDRDTVLAFLDYLEQERGNCVRTRNARLMAIRSFFQHVASCDPVSIGAAKKVLSIPSKRTTRSAVSYLTKMELEAILATPDRRTPQGRRDHILLLFLARTGARVSEVIGVNAADLRLDRPWQVLFRGKGSKERIVPIAEDTAALLRALCKERAVRVETPTPVFVNARGRRLTRYGVIHILRRATTRAAECNPELARRSISPHTLRHTAAMHLLQAGVDLTTIQSWLGHATLNTTHQYIEADVEMKRRALELCDTPDVMSARYQPTDAILALLDGVQALGEEIPPPVQ